ncbi:MAG: DUF2283 domain-containing protein [Dehalococcoidia bacterium]
METTVVERVTQALPLLLSHRQFEWDYDKEADVLYITFEKVEATDSELSDDDVLLRYRDGELIGVTVLHASTRQPSLSAK